MDFISNQPAQLSEMLKVIGVNSIDELFDSIPQPLKNPQVVVDDGLSELELLKEFEAIGKKNTTLDYDHYLGGGAYSHYTPALVGTIISRSEFLTSYTPYQPEISQGLLQGIFEFQSSIAALTTLDVANASVYDGASACAEAILMALRIKKEKRKVLISEYLNPLYRHVVDTYLSGLDIECVTFSTSLEHLDEKTACVLLQSPNFFGTIENISQFSKEIKAVNALLITCGNPLSYALFKSPGEFDVDIAVGDCQPLGQALNFGGPYAGFMACKQIHLRQLPGRLVGQTKDLDGNKGFVLTLQAREQHIRREKATSNICTNQALVALASLVTMLWYGPKGLKALALTNYQRAHFLASNLAKIQGFKINGEFFNEFTLEIPCSEEHYFHHFLSNKIEPGIALSRFYPKQNQKILIAVTELKTLTQLNKYIEVAKSL